MKCGQGSAGAGEQGSITAAHTKARRTRKNTKRTKVKMAKRPTFIPISNTPAGCVQYLKGILIDARATTLQRVESLGQGELDWVYAPGWNSIAALLAHMNANAHCFRIWFIENRQLTPEEESKWVPGQEMGQYVPRFNGIPLQKYIDDLAESQRLIFDAIDSLDFETFVKRREGYDPETGFNLAWCLYHLAEDEVHHRGQISMIRKLYKQFSVLGVQASA